MYATMIIYIGYQRGKDKRRRTTKANAIPTED